MAGNGWSNQVVSIIIIEEGTGFTGLFFYSPTIGPGNLVGSWTVQAGTDPYGNPYPAGLMIQNGVSQFFINAVANGLVQQRWVTGNPGVSVADTALLEAATQGAGNGEWDKLVMQSSLNTTNTDAVNIALFSSSTDGTQKATFIVQYTNVPLGINESYLTVGLTGVNITAGSITASDPTTGTSYTNPALPETWHTPSVSAAWTTVGTGQPVRYRLQPDGTVRLDGEAITTGAGPWPANTTIFTLPAGYLPVANKPFITRSDIAVAAGQATVNVLSGGGVQNGQVFTAAGQRLWFDGITFPVD